MHRLQKMSSSHDDSLLKIDRIPDIVGIDEVPCQNEDNRQTWHVQVFRSIDSNSVKGFPKEPQDAIIGYLMFGAEVESQITLNLPLNKVSSKLAIYTTLVNPISKFALMATPITNALKDLLPRGYKNRVTSILVSTVLVISSTMVALSVPFFGDLMSLVGAFLSVTASILLPCLCYLKISGTYRNFGCETIAILAIIIAAMAMGISVCHENSTPFVMDNAVVHSIHCKFHKIK